MATFDWPLAVYPSGMTWGNRKAGAAFTSPYSGATQFVEFGAERWTVSVALPGARWKSAGAAAAFFERLTGGANRVRLYNWTRPVPLGTMRGTPVLRVAAARGALSLVLTALAGDTLEPGDYFNISGQLFKAAEHAVADGSGVLTVPLVHRVRYATAAGAAVSWDHPTAEFTMPSLTSSRTYAPVTSEGTQIDLEEAW